MIIAEIFSEQRLLYSETQGIFDIIRRLCPDDVIGISIFPDNASTNQVKLWGLPAEAPYEDIEKGIESVYEQAGAKETNNGFCKVSPIYRLFGAPDNR